MGVRLEFHFENSMARDIDLCVEPWAHQVPIRPRTTAKILCHDIDPANPIWIGLVDDILVLNDVGDHVCVSYDGTDHVYGGEAS